MKSGDRWNMKFMHFVALGSVFFSVEASAAPSVFIRADPTTPFWNGTAEARIFGKNAGPVSTEAVNAFLSETMIYGLYEVCSLEAVGSDTFVGIDRETQRQIEEYRGSVTWRAEAIAPGGRRLLGQSVVFESCGGELRGAALLVTDVATDEVLRWEPLGNGFDAAGGEIPSWVMFINASGGDELFSFSGCTECGARTNVYYDITRKKIYTEYNGH